MSTPETTLGNCPRVGAQIEHPCPRCGATAESACRLDAVMPETTLPTQTQTNGFPEQSELHPGLRPETTAQRPGDALRAIGIEPINPFEFIGRRCRSVRITPLIAEELAKQTGGTAQFWLNMQEAFDGR